MGSPVGRRGALTGRNGRSDQSDRGGQGRRPGRAEHSDPVRRAAFDVLAAVDSRSAYANLLLPSVLRERRLTGRDAALATELCYGTLRGQGTYDAILEVCSDRRVARMDPPVRGVLRLGVHQLLATRIATHAAVATSVDLAKDVAGPRPAGFVNAVLRRVSTADLDAWLAVVTPDRAADPVGYLAVRHSYPRWIVAAFGEALGEPIGGGSAGDGPAETEQALAAGNVAPRVTLCAVPGVCDRDELMAAAPAEPATWSPFGVHLSEGDPAAIRAVRERRALVQDEASQLVALALTRADVAGPDRLWLDLCAGPGGKAALLAGLAAGRGARLLAADVRTHRAAMVRDAMAGSGATASGTPAAARDHEGGEAGAGHEGRGDGAGHEGHGSWAGVVVADGTEPGWRAGVFDRVLADVPCCGLGSLRRRPESRWRRSPAQVAELAGLQRSLLRSALDAVRVGGVAGYVTCSPHVAETREVIADVLGGRADVELLDGPALLPEVAGVGCPEPYGRLVQFWPHRHGTDAMFLALIRRIG
jgi:16S rRNA (cytosine967-C5)-methyltransferase